MPPGRRCPDLLEVVVRKALFVLLAAAAVAAFAADDVTVKNVDAMTVAYIRFQGQYTDVGKYCNELFAAIGDKATGPYFAVYYDPPEVKVHDIEVCAPVSAVVESGNVKTRTIEGGEFLMTIHKGPYETISEAWGRLMTYAAANGYEFEGAGREVYVGFDPKDPANNVTEVMQAFVKKK